MATSSFATRNRSVSTLAECLTDMTVSEWLRLLNRQVFFWVREQRVNELLGAQAYRDHAHIVLVLDTATRAPRAPSAAPEEISAKITELVTQNPDGLNGTQIAEHLGVSAATARKYLDGLISAGSIKRTGEKRGTKYVP
jgi:predicted HTH transcriptional regulator